MHETIIEQWKAESQNHINKENKNYCEKVYQNNKLGENHFDI